MALYVSCNSVCVGRRVHPYFRMVTLARTAKKHLGGKKELRRAKRYPLRVPVTFWLERGDGISKAQGTTRDISYRGVFIVSDLLPLVGAHLDVEVYLPSMSAPSNLVELHGEGKVVRTSRRRGSESGFAAEAVFRMAEGSAGSIVSGAEGLIH